MDVSTFYALFAATCFTLVGLWWNVVQGHDDWLRRPALRRIVGGVYLSFLLPALMGLFAQVGGASTPGVWRASFALLAVIGCVSTLRLLAQGRRDGSSPVLAVIMGAAALFYVLIAVVGVVPEIAGVIGLAPIQAEAVLLILLVVLGHGLVWRFMAGEGRPAGGE
ncbi:hypothetical protein E3E14_01115 [Streptomyces sp. ICN441]|uniref:Uncharacterized protein n=1 Tax=Streptomyces tirandamycinicus TaxID=2174846 RepID=A0A2S1SXC8_9ACTN|nr:MULTISPECIES: hypothetical protein [Streptomyces]AWI31070.1 hypothetical protein DDW44_21510 [Streptomyces tirandamycinicus]NNJ03624.1 hypothetical protein [Streptomyces sp. PKU-MA01144]TFE58477.1 hypothetical protein E3E14_01115 [Streptomyces sp. ICN441]